MKQNLTPSDASPASGGECTARKTFGSDTTCLAALLHLASLLKGFDEGPFKAGFETAIEEAGAYLDSLNDDGGDQAQTLMEQMCGLVNGHYALAEIKPGPIGIVASPSPSVTEEEIAKALRQEIRLVAANNGDPCQECGEMLDATWRVKEGNIEHCARAVMALIRGERT